MYPQPCASFVTGTPVSDPRVDHVVIDGVKVDVLLPAGYVGSRRSYPVLYLLNSALADQDEYLTATDLVRFTAQLPGAQQAIVVLPFGGLFGFYSDWRDGSYRWEHFDIDTLIPYVDAHYRTRADRAHRAVAGFSMGGFGAISYAARHPELFTVAGSFSGQVDPAIPRMETFLPGFMLFIDSVCGQTYQPLGLWGNPATDAVWWRDHDPTDLAGNLSGVSLYFASGNGVPCQPDELQENPLATYLESLGYEQAQNFDAALTTAGVAHAADLYGCGTHVYRFVQRDIHRFWPQMLAAFGSASPSSFDYRRADPHSSAWGWTFTADPRRAAEFLDITHASPAGLTLRGSGTETVTTPPLWDPGQAVDVHGGSPTHVRADSAGRVTFTVGLGAPHRKQQYTLAQQLSPELFVTRTIRFDRAGGSRSSKSKSGCQPFHHPHHQTTTRAPTQSRGRHDLKPRRCKTPHRRHH